MVVLVLSDIHGNFHALQSVLTASKSYPWQEIWFLGDLCGYGPRPDDCFHLLAEYKTVIIPGNHDLYLTGRLSGTFFSDQSLRSLIHTRSFISGKTLQYIKNLPVTEVYKGITLVHGSPVEPSTDYILNENDAWSSFFSFRGRCCLFGHTHIQEYYQLSGKQVFQKVPEPEETVSFKKTRLLINPGSVGQPRDGNPQASWGLLDTRGKTFTFFRTSYDIAATQNEMRENHSAEFLIQRLEKGI